MRLVAAGSGAALAMSVSTVFSFDVSGIKQRRKTRSATTEIHTTATASRWVVKYCRNQCEMPGRGLIEVEHCPYDDL